MAKPSGHPVPQSRVLAILPDEPAQGTVDWSCKYCTPGYDPKQRPATALWARRPRPGDGAANVVLSYEHARPHVEPDSGRLRDIMNMPRADLESLDPSAAHGMFRDVCRELSSLLSRPTQGRNLNDCLNSCSQDDA
eukprot:3846133-Pyramimonas_sp.AAC.1